MKATFTLMFVLFIGVCANAQGSNKEINKEITPTETVSKNKIDLKEKNEVVRLYKFKNSKIKKELSFSTKRGKSKLA